MHRSSSVSLKLPHWQANVPHRRTTLSRRNRFFIIVIIFIIAWYQCSGKLASKDIPAIVEIDLPRPYVQQRAEPQKIFSHEDAYPAEEGSVAVEPAEEELAVVEHYKPALEVEEPEEGGLSAKEKAAPAVVQRVDHLKDKLNGQGLTNPAHGFSAEYEEENEAGSRQAVLDDRHKPEASQGNVVSEAIDKERPASAKEKSERLLEQHLAPAPKFEEDIPRNIPKTGPPRFSSYAEFAELDGRAEVLPDIVHIPFEAAMLDVTLEGWEDQWFADAELDIPRWGKLNETKIDFVYTCKGFSVSTSQMSHFNLNRGQWFRYCFSRYDLPLRSQQYSE